MYRVVFKDPCRCALQRTLQRQSGRQYSNNNSSSNNNSNSNSKNSNGLPPNAREAGFGKVVLFLTPLTAVGGVITYAKYDNEFRKKVESNIPGSESIIKVALREEVPFKGITSSINKQVDSVKSQFDSVSNSINSVTSKVTGLFGTSDDKAKSEDKGLKIKETSGHPSLSIIKSKDVKPANQSKELSAQKVTPVKAKPEPLPTSVLELEKAVEVAAALAVKEYNKAIETLKSFNSEVRNVVDKAVENIDSTLWTTLKNRSGARDTAVSTAEQLAREAQDKIEKCQLALSKAVTAQNTEQVEKVRSKIKKLNEHIIKVKEELYQQKDNANVSDKYWQSVEKARNYFVEEIESLFPGLKLSQKKLDLSKEDLDLFILHAYSHVLTLQKELQNLTTEGELRLKRAIDAARGDNSSEASKAQLEYMLVAEKRKLALENQKKIFQIHAEADKTLRAQLKKQAEAHADHLKDIVKQRETELTRAHNRELEDKLAAEKANYKLQLASMVGKLRGMDQALAARAEMERSANKAQALWAACQALWTSVRTVNPNVDYRYKLRPLKNEIYAITKIAGEDDLVTVIIQNLPHEARDRGVFPEDALRERFLTVERVARKVAIVPEEGASLPIYFLSYLQSVFVMRPDNPISKDELEDKPFDYSKLDTYNILDRARYYVDRSDLLQALKYMNLLQGAPRRISSDWVKEARILLETQQAANTLMAHASANGLLYL